AAGRPYLSWRRLFRPATVCGTYLADHYLSYAQTNGPPVSSPSRSWVGSRSVLVLFPPIRTSGRATQAYSGSTSARINTTRYPAQGLSVFHPLSGSGIDTR